MKILGLDYGGKHIGMASSDAMGVLASAFATLENKSKDFAVSEIKKICQDKGISKIVIGLPVSLTGEEGIQAKQVRKFADYLRKKINIPVVFEDERLTTVMAKKFLREKKTRIKKRESKEHKLAAQIILQDYLDKSI